MIKAAHIVLAAFGALLLATAAQAQEFEVDDVARKLAREGFSNVRSLQMEGQRIYTIQNDRYKLQAEGIAKALSILKEAHKSDSVTCKLIATYYDIPQVTLTYEPLTGSCETSYRLDDSWKQVRRQPKSNSSFGKVDIVVYPQVSLMNLVIIQVYQSLWQLSPALEVSLWPGMKFTGLLKIPVYNDGYGAAESKVHPCNLTLSQRFRDPWGLNVFGKATVGIFSSEFYGAALELFRPFRNERFSLEGQLGYIGTGRWDGFVYHYIKMDRFCWSVGANYYWPLVNTQFTVRAQKFASLDTGVKFEMIRHFRHCSIGFYAMKGFDGAKTNGGFRFQIALPPYRMRRYGYIPRVTTSGQMGLVYNANNERNYYKEYKTEASDNIMEHNGFNPYYIDSEIVKLNY